MIPLVSGVVLVLLGAVLGASSSPARPLRGAGAGAFFSLVLNAAVLL